MKKNLPYQASFTFTKNNYNNAQKILLFGGLVFEETRFFEVYLLRSDLTMLSIYKSKVIDDVSFSPVNTNPKPEITLYQGGNITMLD